MKKLSLLDRDVVTTFELVRFDEFIGYHIYVCKNSELEHRHAYSKPATNWQAQYFLQGYLLQDYCAKKWTYLPRCLSGKKKRPLRFSPETPHQTLNGVVY